VVSRILVKGGSGAGKSTLALRLAEMLNLPYVELDALHHGPNCSAASAEELKARVLGALDDTRGWVVDGNYDSKLGATVTDRADLIVWLDVALPTKLWRLTWRTARRLLRREELWNGNRETLRGVFWGNDALFAWAVTTHFRHRRDWPKRFAGRTLVRLRTTREVNDWLTKLMAQVQSSRASAASNL
jgi:adenylate kinase family enzyme